ncbi:ABC transporter ATP-binding protein [Porphyromonas sp. COT-239 OH1446]|uniref:ABC transporter ATP-binding protein n=1 Tax=Porphyromonas sp. COT-239 OH1446 TaxID=1515613 RepID=UPI00052D2E6E|nr:ABC transporter ATP-binding protein [Porphyromonas sp. COT-239 OH1446]KGN70171.1 lipoprotein ABC transporter ATP-binding protein [Porphyromonas sp. COT-239 OH1446]
MVIEARNIHKTFGTLEVLKGIDLDIAPREIVSIVGSSGAGKTTLLQILGTLSPSDPGGCLRIGGVEVSSLSPREEARFRNRELGFIFQFHQLLPEFTALENVMMPALIMGRRRREVEARAAELLERLSLWPRQGHKPGEMSGGECQRVAVARALMNEPRVILADEPSGSLDSTNKQELHDLIFDLRRDLGQTFVIVTHDLELARRADRMISLRDGMISGVEESSPQG